MRHRVASAASSALRRSFTPSVDRTSELLYPAAATARDSLVASTSGRTMDEAGGVPHRRQTSSTSTSLSSSSASSSSTLLFAPRVSRAFSRQLHHSMSPAQGALPEVRQCELIDVEAVGRGNNWCLNRTHEKQGINRRQATAKRRHSRLTLPFLLSLFPSTPIPVRSASFICR